MPDKVKYHDTGITIPKVTPEDAGKYTCWKPGKWRGKKKSGTVEIFVGGMPLLVIICQFTSPLYFAALYVNCAYFWCYLVLP